MGYDLKNMTANKALFLALTISGKSREDICESTGLGYETIARYFNPNDNYQPSLRHVPSLCRALGNVLLIEWQFAQIDDLDESKGLSVTKFLKGVATLGSETGHVFSKAAQAMEDGMIDAEEAKDLNGELADVEKAAHTLRERLQPIAGQILEGGKLHKVLIVSEDGQ